MTRLDAPPRYKLNGIKNFCVVQITLDLEKRGCVLLYVGWSSKICTKFLDAVTVLYCAESGFRSVASFRILFLLFSYLVRQTEERIER